MPYHPKPCGRNVQNSITLTVNDRPHYLRRCLETLSQVCGIAGWHLYVGLEPGNAECAALCRNIDFMPRTILYNREKLGVRGNPYHVLQHAFAQGSELNIYLEDDLIVSPDICSLALWYKKLIPEDKLFDVRIFFLSLFVTSLGGEAADEFTASEIFSPWGLIMNRYQWENLIGPNWWDDNHRYPCERDWTISLAHQMNTDTSLTVLAPLLSRSLNIGREDGVHSHPERHDLLMKGLAMSHDAGPFSYKINPAAKIPWRHMDYQTMTAADKTRQPTALIAPLQLNHSSLDHIHCHLEDLEPNISKIMHHVR